MSTSAVIQFSNNDAAAGLVAGLPAAARAVHEAAQAGIGECWLRADDAKPLDGTIRQEICRLAGAMEVRGLDGLESLLAIPAPAARSYAFAAGGAAVALVLADPDPELAQPPLLFINGEALVPAAAIKAALANGVTHDPALVFASPAEAPRRVDFPNDAAPLASRYAAAGRAIVKATAKPTDGIVSRSLNRPISQPISRFLLRFAAIRPIHATIGTAALGLLMFVALVTLGSPVGLVAGALLFQAASVFDGVDGEIARATFRTSDRGAMIDTLIDAAINLGFLAGIVINLAQRGRWVSAMFGISGLVILVVGLTALGRLAKRRGAPISFDGLKQHFRERSRWGQWAVWLTMRDFLALAAAVLVIAGLTDQAVIAFSVLMAIWLVVVLISCARQSVHGG